MKNWIKTHKLIIACLMVFLAGAIFIFSYHLPTVDVLTDGGVEVCGDSALADFVAVEGGRIFYECHDENVDFEKSATVKVALPELPWGGYEISFAQQANPDSEAWCDNYIGIASLDCGRVNALLASDFYLLKFNNSFTEPFWINRAPMTDLVTLEISFLGPGSAVIDSIVIKESLGFKWGLTLLLAAVLGLVCFWYYGIRLWAPKKKVGLLAFVLLVLFSSFPALFGNHSVLWGLDGHFHLNRIASLANELSFGHFPVLYDSATSDGLGYIHVGMYPDALLYIPAVLHLLGLPVSDAYNVYVVVINALTCWLAWVAFKGTFKEESLAFLGTALYVLAAGRLSVTYVQGDVGEFTVMAFLPLLIYGFYRLYFQVERPRFSDALPLIIATTGITESHVLSCQLVAEFLVIFLLCNLKRTVEIFKVLAKALVAIVLVNLYFLVPFISLYGNELIVNSITESRNMSATAAYFFQLFSPFMSTGKNIVSFDSVGDMPYTIGGPLVMGLIAFIIVLIYRNQWQQEGVISKASLKPATQLFAMGLFALWLSSAYFPWGLFADRKSAIALQLVAMQFPFRFVTLATVFFCFTAVYAFKVLRDKGFFSEKAGMAVVVGFAVLMVGLFFNDFTNTSEEGGLISARANNQSDTLYLPVGLNPRDSAVNTITVYGDAHVDYVGDTKENHHLYQVSGAKEDSVVTLPVAYYNYLYVYDVETGEPLDSFMGYNSQLAVDIPEGYEGTIGVTYEVAISWKIAFFVSLVSFLALVFIAAKLCYIKGADSQLE